MGSAVAIGKGIVAEIVARAAGTRDEVCGLLLGTQDRVTGVLHCANVAADPATAFEIDPGQLIAAYRQARGGGPAVVGCYHSHPSGAPVPSPRDAAGAGTADWLWLIAADGGLGVYRVRQGGQWHGRFKAVDLVDGGAEPRERLAPPTPLRHKGARHTRSPMPVTPVEFASLLCSRLCHDLLSPVGALNNGLELLADETDPAMRDRCLELLADSARASANKLKFFRLAFGAAGGFGDQVDTREAQGALEGLLAGNKRVELGWLVEAPTLPKPAAKVLLNLGMIAADALVRGGRLDIGGEEEGGRVEIVARLEGPRVVLDAEIRRTLTDGETGEVTPRVAAAWLVYALAAGCGGSVQVSEPADNVMILGATMLAG